MYFQDPKRSYTSTLCVGIDGKEGLQSFAAPQLCEQFINLQRAAVYYIQRQRKSKLNPSQGQPR